MTWAAQFFLWELAIAVAGSPVALTLSISPTSRARRCARARWSPPMRIPAARAALREAGADRPGVGIYAAYGDV